MSKRKKTKKVKEEGSKEGRKDNKKERGVKTSPIRRSIVPPHVRTHPKVAIENLVTRVLH